MSELLAPFSDPQAVARYAEGPPRFVPGFADLHHMTTILLTERAPENARVRLHKGYIDDAPEGPFDAATCLLTLHFLPPEERRRTVSEIRRRLKPGAPFVAAHSSFPQGEGERSMWLSRYAAFAIAKGADPSKIQHMRTAVEAHLSLLSPEQDAALLRDVGFSDVTLFYAAFTWRGWVAYA